MKIVENGILPMGGYKAMTVLKWIFVRYGVKLSDKDINHESIHWEQEKELLIIGFYLLYGLMFAWELVRCLFDSKRGLDGAWKRSWGRRAYRSIAFEREAYANEAGMDYIKTRRHYAWARKKNNK